MMETAPAIRVFIDGLNQKEKEALNGAMDLLNDRAWPEVKEFLDDDSLEPIKNLSDGEKISKDAKAIVDLVLSMTKPMTILTADESSLDGRYSIFADEDYDDGKTVTALVHAFLKHFKRKDKILVKVFSLDSFEDRLDCRFFKVDAKGVKDVTPKC